MKKLVLTIGLMLVSFSSYAQVDLGQYAEKIPVTKHGLVYSAIDNEFNYAGALEIAKWKNLSFDIGYAGRAENTKDKLIGSVSLKLLSLRGIVPLPILEDLKVEPMAYVGIGRITGSNEFDVGVGATFLQVKF